MKKIILELIITAGVVVTMIFSGNMIKNSVYAVDVYKIKPSTVKDTVICSGKIQYKETCEVSYENSGIVKDVRISKGDIVEKNDVLFTVISELSENYISSDNNLSGLLSKSETKVKSPVSGIILDVSVKPEDIIVNNVTAVTIVNSKDLCVLVPVSESKIANVAEGQKVNISGTALGDKIYTGVVSEIDNVAKQVSTTLGKETAVNVTIDIDNPDDKIKQGYTAKCVITTNVKNNDYVVPYEAIEMNNENQGIVYTYQNGKALKKSVKTGNEYENGVEILEGIKENDLIIKNPEKITNKDSIKINSLLENNDD